MRRSAVEEFTDIRYFAIKWVRRVALVTINDDGEETVLRNAGAEEHSRFRSNLFPYTESHGLSVSSGGLVERADERAGGLRLRPI